MKTYDPKQIQVIVGVRAITGFAEDTMVTVARTSDAFTLTMGADGEGTRAKSNDKSGTFTLELMQSSESNAYLSNLALADELNNGGIVPVLVKDSSGASLHGAEQAYIQKDPDAVYGKTVGNRTWIITTDNLKNYNGGN